MSGGSTKTTKQETSTSSNSIDPRQLALLEDNYARAKANAGRLKAYDGTLTTGFTPTQVRTQEMLAGIANDGSGRAALTNASGAVQEMLRYRPASLPVANIAAPLVTGATPVAAQGVAASRVAAQAPVQTGATDVALAAAHGPVTAERMAAATIAPQSALNAPVIDAASAAREAPVSAERITAGQLAGTDLSAYANPFTEAVIDRTITGNERARRIALAENARKASAANAFGGSRSAVLDAAMGEAYDRNTLDALAGLNRENFVRSQDMAMADIDRRFQTDQFNAGNRFAADTLNANLGQQVTLANQAALNAARERNAAHDIATGQFNANLGQAAALANQAAQNDVARFNAESRLSADTLNANLGQQVALANQAARNELARFDAGNALNAGQFNASLAQAAALANQASDNDAARFNAGNRLSADTLNANLGQQAMLANQNAEMSTRQFNAEAARAAAQGDIDNALAAYGLGLNAAGQLVSLNNAGLSDAITRAGLLGSVGDAQQALAQAGLNADYQEYLRQQQFPMAEQQMLNSALGLIPVQQTTTSNTSGSGTEKTGGGLMGILGGLGALGQGLGAMGLSFSDGDLKTDVETLRHDSHGRRWVSFRYLWEPEDVRHEGVIAQEILKTDPHAVHLGRDGFYRVDYSRLETA